ncbi:MAG TPA: DinB family protein [Candidatus Acidoferrum sp.]|nr:DinB family protein [Candidatus Acidoferrum sp.]
MQQGVARSTEPAVTGSIQPALSLLEKTPILLETMLRDLPEELLRWKPAPDRWSIAEVLGHLADIEMVYADRTRRIVTEDTPVLQKFDPAGTVVVGDYVRGSASENLAFFIKTRRATVILLRSIPADSGECEATHSELGTITLHQMLNEWASHDLGHLRQIAELYRARAFHRYAGPFQKYSQPKP